MNISPVNKIVALQSKPGSQLRDLRIESKQGKSVVVGSVPNYHALQQVITALGGTVGYDVNVKSYDTNFVFDQGLETLKIHQHEAA